MVLGLDVGKLGADVIRTVHGVGYSLEVSR